MSQNPQEVAERLEEVNEAVQELRGKRSQFYNDKGRFREGTGKASARPPAPLR